MSAPVLERVSAIDTKTHVIFLVTAAREWDMQAEAIITIEPVSGEELKIRGWFSSIVLSNLEKNSRLTLIVWNMKNNDGYQLKGRCLQKKDFQEEFIAPGERAIPRMECELTIRIDRTIGLSKQT
ncbi:MAG: hypothetical protein JNN05_06175 [Candidatus Omnitrophica bacterium]|nr:hypothetical protein [Candidatus Omnitrophota bacterium]